MFIEFMCMFHAINQLMFVAVHEQNMFYLFRQKGSKAWIAFREPGEFQLSNSFYCYKLMCMLFGCLDCIKFYPFACFCYLLAESYQFLMFSLMSNRNSLVRL